MKLFVIFLIVNVGIASAYIISAINEITDEVNRIDSDFEGNTYVVTRKNISYRMLHKLNPSKELVWTVEIPYPDYPEKVIVNSQNDLFYLFVDVNQLYPGRIAVLRYNSTTFEEIDTSYGSLFFTDREENIFYCKEVGFYVLRPNTNVPVAIKGLEDDNPRNPGIGAVDSKGNVYFSVRSPLTSTTHLAVITKENLHMDVPSANIILGLEQVGQLARTYFTDNEDNFWVFKTDFLSGEGSIEKLTNNEFKLIFLDHNHQDVTGLPTRNRIYVVATEEFGENNPSIYYLKLENLEVVDVPGLKNLTRAEIKVLSDEEDHVYFSADKGFTSELGDMILMDPVSEVPTPIRFADKKYHISNLFLDHNSDVWIIDSFMNIHYLKKGETTAEKIPNIGYFEGCTKVKSNPVAKEIFFGCETGLYVAVENN